MFIQKKTNRNGHRRIMSSEEAGTVFVEPEATELLFETEDVADILAEATGEDVAVTSDPSTDAVTFDVGGEQYEVTPEGDEEVLEASRRARGRRISASHRALGGSRRTPTRPAVRASRRLGRRNIGR